MSASSNPTELVGTWRWKVSYRKSGEPLPPQPANIPKVSYLFAPDGTGIMMPDVLPMRLSWSAGNGQLRITTAVPKSRSTHDYECVDFNTLVLHDRHGGRNVFERVTDVK
jgi:hypothetical protein